jgi:hypothetical protein
MVQASQGGLFVTKRSMAVPDCRAPTSTSMRFFGMDLDRTSPSGTHCSATARKLLPADGNDLLEAGERAAADEPCEHRHNSPIGSIGDHRGHRMRTEPDAPDASTTVYRAGVAGSVGNIALTNPPLTADQRSSRSMAEGAPRRLIGYGRRRCSPGETPRLSTMR